MADSFILLNPGVGPQKADTEELVIGANTVQRERLQVAGASALEIARVENVSPSISDYALITRNLPATPTTSTLSGTAISFVGAGDNVVVAGVAAQTIRVFKLFLVVAGTTILKFVDGTPGGTDLSGAMSMTSGGTIVLDFDTIPWMITSAGNDFVINISVGVQVSGRIEYTQS